MGKPFPINQFTTSRLHVRDWTDTLADPSERRDLTAALEIILTPPVLAPLPPSLSLINVSQSVSTWIDERARESNVFLLNTRSLDNLVGLLILAPFTSDTGPMVVHLGYLLAEDAWGKGFASELVAGLVTALETAEPLMLSGGVARDNPASARVLMKAGFQEDTAQSNPEMQVFVRSNF